MLVGAVPCAASVVGGERWESPLGPVLETVSGKAQVRLGMDEPNVKTGGGGASLGPVEVAIDVDTESTVVDTVRGRIGPAIDPATRRRETKRVNGTEGMGALEGRCVWRLRRSYDDLR